MKQENRAPRKRNRSWIFTLILVVILLVGAGIMAYPTVSDWWNSFHQSRVIASYSAIVEETDTGEIEKLLGEAEEYNARLARRENRFLPTEEETEEYNGLLDLAGDGVMGVVQISAIGVNLPICHGTSESVLQTAVGHIEGSSLPVGGPGTHAVLSGHRGLPSAKLFTELDKLVEGDVFTITVLGRTLTYVVDQIRIVEPSDMSDLRIVPGKDYCTLVTCTPYSINTHRLLVRGHRIENAAEEVVVTGGAVRVPNYLVILAIGVPMLFVFLLVMLVFYSIRRPAKTQEELLALIRAAGAQTPEDSGPETAGENGDPDPGGDRDN